MFQKKPRVRVDPADSPDAGRVTITYRGIPVEDGEPDDAADITITLVPQTDADNFELRFLSSDWGTLHIDSPSDFGMEFEDLANPYYEDGGDEDDDEDDES